MSVTIRQRRIRSLDGLRAISVILVMLGHGAEAYAPGALHVLWLAPLLNSSLGVRFFFVLSGFLITSLLVREQGRTGRIDWPAFLYRRCLRIWPALYTYLLTMVVLMALGVVAISPEQLLAAATFTWNYAGLWVKNGTAQGDWFLGHLWTLALEQQFYIAWPLLIAWRGWRLATRVSVVLPLLLPLLRVLSYFLFPEQRGYLGMMFHTAIDSILIGCAFSLHQERLRGWLARWPGVIPLAFVFVFLVSPLVAELIRPYRITIGFGLDGLCCGMIILAAQQQSRWASLLAWPPLVALGTISYGLYIWQQPFLTHWNHTFTGSLPWSVIAAISCAVASWFLIEKPALRAKDLFERASL